MSARSFQATAKFTNNGGNIPESQNSNRDSFNDEHEDFDNDDRNVLVQNDQLQMQSKTF